MSDCEFSVLIDVGNTRVKAVLSERETLTPLFQCDSQSEVLAAALQQQMPAKPLALVYASVAAESLNQCIEQWASAQACPCLKVVSEAEGYGLRSAYQEPSQLGDDRWAAMLGAYHHAKGACLVIDCGTAVTVDLVDAKGLHLGGAIFPGERSMKASLVSATHRLPWVSGQAPAFGDSTAACIAGGTSQAVLGAINHYIGEARRLLCATETLAIYLTGGGADELRAWLHETVRFRPLLVHEGLEHVRQQWERCEAEPMS